MASSDSSCPPDSTAEAEVIFQRGVLHPFGVSLLVIIHKACTRAQNIRGPIGSVTEKFTTFVIPAIPFICAVQYEWLVLLTFFDDHIRVVANMLRYIFPPLSNLFKKIDKFIDTAESLPEKFDEAVNKIPVIIHRLPFLHSALTTFIVWINFLIVTFTQWRIASDTREKDIMVDTSYHNYSDGSTSGEHCENSERLIGTSSASCKGENKVVEEVQASDVCDNSRESISKCDHDTTTIGVAGVKSSYKEILEKGTREGIRKERDNANDDEISETKFCSGKGGQGEEENDENGSIENNGSEDPILELFDTSWQTNSTKGSCSLPGSFSFS